MTDNTTRRELLTNVAKALPLAAVAVAAGEQTAVAAPKGGNGLTTLISSVVPGSGGFVGTMTVNSVGVANGVLTAAGQITGNVFNNAGALVGSVTAFPVTAPLQVTGTCTILNLVLGPLHLNLLGLVVDLNQVVLTITAVAGAGNLLGNLLCAVANLLNGGGGLAGLLQGIADLLNQILGGI